MKKKQVKNLRLTSRTSASFKLAQYKKNVYTASARGVRLSFTAATAFILLAGSAMALTTSSTVQAAACPYDATLGSTDPTNTVNIPSAGEYTIWTRMIAPTTSSNKVYLQIDADTCFSVGGGSFVATSWLPGSENWVKYADGAQSSVIKMNLTAGNHTFVYKGQQANVQVDKIVFTADPACVPVGVAATPCPTGTDTTPPTVNITSPANNANVNNPVTINAAANDGSGSGVRDVQFLNGTQVLGTDATSPYSFTGSLVAGSKTITAKATDNAGLTTTSSPVTITVSGGGGGAKRGDISGSSPGVPDGVISLKDLSYLLINWGSNKTPAQGDISGPTPGTSDGNIDLKDLSYLLINWG